MDLLINKTYFYGVIAIPDKNEEGSNIERAMPQYQSDFLRLILGDHYSLLFDADDLSVNTTEVYKAIYGSNFAVDGKNFIYKGLVNEDDLLSAIADYVFIKYQEERVQSNDSFGLSGNNSTELSTKLPFMNRTAEAWRRIEAVVYRLYDYIYYSTDSFWSDFDYPFTKKNSNSWQV
jgi:hypothetical protein